MATEKVSLKEKISGSVVGTFGSAWETLFNPNTESNLRAQYPSAYTGPQPGIPDLVKAKYDATMRSAGRKIWKGITQVAASGFGKGVLITAGIILAGMAIAYGLGTFAAVPTIAGPLAATFEQGVAQGVIAGGNFLLGSIAGLVTLAVGGTIGAISDVRKHQNKITAEIAKTQAEQYNRIREMKTLEEMEAAKGMPLTANVSEPSQELAGNFAAREAQRRAAETQNNPYRNI